MGAEELSPAQYGEFVFPYLAQIAVRVKQELADISLSTPLACFVKGCEYGLERLARESAYDVIRYGARAFDDYYDR